MGVFPTVVGEATSPENMEASYASVRSWDREEEDDAPFPDWKGFGEYLEPVDPTPLSSNFASVLKYIQSLLN